MPHQVPCRPVRAARSQSYATRPSAPTERDAHAVDTDALDHGRSTAPIDLVLHDARSTRAARRHPATRRSRGRRRSVRDRRLRASKRIGRARAGEPSTSCAGGRSDVRRAAVACAATTASTDERDSSARARRPRQELHPVLRDAAVARAPSVRPRPDVRAVRLALRLDDLIGAVGVRLRRSGRCGRRSRARPS